MTNPHQRTNQSVVVHRDTIHSPTVQPRLVITTVKMVENVRLITTSGYVVVQICMEETDVSYLNSVKQISAKTGVGWF
mgnify:CR=1 FL=1